MVIMSWTEAVLGFVPFMRSFQLTAQDCPELDLEREGGGLRDQWGHSRQKEECGQKEASKDVDCSTLILGVADQEGSGGQGSM